jgi:hypothetical protein
MVHESLFFHFHCHVHRDVQALVLVWKLEQELSSALVWELWGQKMLV